MKKQEVFILIPCFNEIKDLPKITKRLKNYNVLVINDFSNDGTKTFLKKNNINHLNTKKQEGQINALIIGFKFILKNYKKCKYIITFDADGEHKVSDIKKFINKIKFKPDIVLGIRNRKNRLMEKIISFLFYSKFNIKDPMSGFKMIGTNIIKKNLKYLNNKYFLIDFLINVREKAHILNVNISSPKRRDNSRHQNFLINFKIIKTLIRYF